MSNWIYVTIVGDYEISHRMVSLISWLEYCFDFYTRDHFVHAPSQWEMIGIILCMRLANERRHYIVTLAPIGWVHTQNDPCYTCLESTWSYHYWRLHSCVFSWKIVQWVSLSDTLSWRYKLASDTVAFYGQAYLCVYNAYHMKWK